MLSHELVASEKRRSSDGARGGSNRGDHVRWHTAAFNCLSFLTERSDQLDLSRVRGHEGAVVATVD